MALDQQKKEKYLKKFLEEKTSAIKARQIRINNWLENEKLYNGVPTTTLLTRSNLHVPKVFEAIQTTSSKLGQMPEVEFDTKPEGDENSIEIMKALWDHDIARSDGDTIAQNSKIEAGLYGRAVYKLIPSNEGAKIELIDTMSFLINPTAKSTKDALYCGQQFIYKTIEQLEEDADEFEYDKDEILKLKAYKEASETSANYSQEKSLKDLRLTYLGYANTSQLGAKMAEINEWYTVIKRQWHVMTVANDRHILRCVPVSEVGLEKHPYVSWATFPRGVVFWTPGVADIVRDPNLAMDVSINQMIDNNTYRNFGMMFVSSSSGLKQSSIVPRPLGVTSVNVGLDKNVKDSVWQFTPPEISSANATLQTISQIAENAVGLSSTPIGHKGKMTVTQQAQQSGIMESKTNLLRQNYIKAWQELAQMYADVISKNLTKPRKVKVYGYKPVTIEGVTKKNFTDVEFIAKATSAENSQENKAIKQKAASNIYELFKDDPKIPGQLFLRERTAKAFDMEATDIDKLFTADKNPGQPDTPLQPTQNGQAQNPQQPQAPVQTPPANPEQPQLSANGQATAAQVPAAIR